MSMIGSPHQIMCQHAVIMRAVMGKEVYIGLYFFDSKCLVVSVSLIETIEAGTHVCLLAL